MASMRTLGEGTDKDREKDGTDPVESPDQADALTWSWEATQELQTDLLGAQAELEQLADQVRTIESTNSPAYSDAGFELAGLNDQATEAQALMKELGENRGGILQLMRDAVQFERVRETYVENFHARMDIQREHPGIGKEMEQAEKEYKDLKESLDSVKHQAKAAKERVNGLKAAHQAAQKYAEGRFQAANEQDREQAAIRLSSRGNSEFREAHPAEAVKAQAEIAKQEAARSQEAAKEQDPGRTHDNGQEESQEQTYTQEQYRAYEYEQVRGR